MNIRKLKPGHEYPDSIVLGLHIQVAMDEVIRLFYRYTNEESDFGDMIGILGDNYRIETAREYVRQQSKFFRPI